MNKFAVLAASSLLAMFAASPAFAADAAVDAAVRAFADALHKGDMKAFKAMHVASPTIIDEFAPHYWSGANGFDSWAGDLGKFEAGQGISASRVTIGAPQYEVVSGDHAYVVAPSSYSFQQKGAALRETAQITIVLDKSAAGWKVASWSWAGRDPKPVK
ncbi:MAG: nuclear transport factor 2 family protein [Alphaproteobacteria bacterium]|nr:nuclear transport factor 2 family protein [Alphaproteobacteria bacterium]